MTERRGLKKSNTRKVRKPGSGKQKGSAFERVVCKRLSLWVSSGKKEDCFWRSAMSGGRSTRGAKVGKDLARQAGDITAVSPEGHQLTNHFYIECKHVRNLSFGSFVLGRGGMLRKFWLTAIEESARYGRRPLLIARQNNMPVLVVGLPGTFVSDILSTILVSRPEIACQITLFDDLLSQRFNHVIRRYTK